MSKLSTALAAWGGLLLVLGTASGVIKSRLYISEPLIALIFEGRLYAVTPGMLVAEGLEPLNTDEFSNNLEELGDTVPSSIAGSDEAVYATREGQPYTLEIEKP